MQPEITDEIRLIGPGGFEAASAHEKKNYWTVDLVARAYLKRRLSVEGMNRARGIEFHVRF